MLRKGAIIDKTGHFYDSLAVELCGSEQRGGQPHSPHLTAVPRCRRIRRGTFSTRGAGAVCKRILRFLCSGY
jgi:hypothetical protein